MTKPKLIIIVIAVLIVENIVLWYGAVFYYQGQLHESRIKSKEGHAEVCKSITIPNNLFSVLEKMDKYPPDLIYIDSTSRIHLSYGSEFSRGFAVGAGVGFIFDKDYRLIQKSCEGKSVPE